MFKCQLYLWGLLPPWLLVLIQQLVSYRVDFFLIYFVLCSVVSCFIKRHQKSISTWPQRAACNVFSLSVSNSSDKLDISKPICGCYSSNYCSQLLEIYFHQVLVVEYFFIICEKKIMKGCERKNPFWQIRAILYRPIYTRGKSSVQLKWQDRKPTLCALCSAGYNIILP